MHDEVIVYIQDVWQGIILHSGCMTKYYTPFRMYDKVLYSIQVVWQGEVGIGAKVNSVDAKVKAVNTKASK